MHGEINGAEAPTLSDYMRVLRRRAWVIVVVTAAAVTLTMIIVSSTKPRYESTSQVLLSRDSPAAVLTGTTGSNDKGDPERFIQTQLEVATTNSLARRVLARAGVRGRSPAELLRATEVVAPASTDVLDFRVQDDDRVLSGRLADAFAQEFTVYQRELDQNSLRQALADIADRLAELRRDGQVDEPNFRDLSAKQKQLEAIQPLLTGKAVVLARAGEAVRVRPAPKRDLVVAVAVGLLLGAILAFVVDAVDRRVYSVRGLVDELDAPLLGQIPRRRLLPPEHLSISADAGGAEMEAYQVLRSDVEAALELAGLELPGACLMFSSARRRDGKSTVVANLGVAFALAHKRVIVIDADERASLPGVFGAPDRPGLIDVARGTAELDEALSTAPMGNGRLRVLPLGDPTTASDEALASEQLSAVLARLRSGADVVLLNAPLLLEGRGAMQLAGYADALAVVAAADGAPVRTLESIRAAIGPGPPVNLGLIATGVDSRARFDRPATLLAMGDRPRRDGAMQRSSEPAEIRGAARVRRQGSTP